MIIFNADDFGWTHGHNLAVKQTHESGVLNRASLMCNTPGFEEAVQFSQMMPGLAVGVHLALNEGWPLTNALSALTRPDNAFYDNLLPLVVLWMRGRLSFEEGLREWRAQLERALRADIRVTHLDSHKHVHMLPPLLDVIIRLANEYNIPYVRLPLENFSGTALRRGLGWFGLWTLAKRARRYLVENGIDFADRFIGIAASGMMTRERVIRAIRLSSGRIVEVMLHPAVVTPEVDEIRSRYTWAKKYRFEDELKVLCDEDVVSLVNLSGRQTVGCGKEPFL